MEALFENQKLKVTYLGICDDDTRNNTHTFKINVKEFDTPVLNVEYDDNDKVIIRTWIDEEDENIPKSHIVYKLFSLIEFEVLEIMRFIIIHI